MIDVLLVSVFGGGALIATVVCLVVVFRGVLSQAMGIGEFARHCRHLQFMLRERVRKADDAVMGNDLDIPQSVKDKRNQESRRVVSEDALRGW